MEETSTPASVSMRAAPKVSATKSRRPPAALRSWIPRPAYVAITFVLLLTIGWGAFSIIGRQAQSDEDDELADLESFKEESASLGEPDPSSKPPSGSSSSSRDITSRTYGQRANPWQVSPHPGSSELPALFATPDNSPASFERTPFDAGRNHQTTSGAWLIGTIEADDAPGRISVPPRVSQTAADGPLLR